MPQITSQKKTNELVVIERRSHGNFYGFIEQVFIEGKSVALTQLPELISRVDDFQDEIDDLQKVDIGAINFK